MPIVYACIAPHGDELIPKLAGKNRAVAVESTMGMKKLASEMKMTGPDTIVIASPHNLRLMGRIGVVVAENSSGNVGDRKSQVSLRAKCDVKFAREVLAASERVGLPVAGANYGAFTGPLSNMPMDWGTLIPLWFFLKMNRLKSRIVIVTPSRDIPLDHNFRFGVKVAEVAEASEKKVAFVASADQAHAHDRKGPYGFSPKARLYDGMVVDAVERGRLSDILKFDPEIVEEARPDSLWQMAMLAGVLETVNMKGRLHSYQVLSYFGMLCAGYLRATK